MNKDHLLRIFTNYINSFEIINNNDHQEYYKWQIIKRLMFITGCVINL